MRIIPEAPKTGWFVATCPEDDYKQLKDIAARSVFGDSDKVETLDFLAGFVNEVGIPYASGETNPFVAGRAAIP